MFGFGKKKHKQDQAAADAQAEAPQDPALETRCTAGSDAAPEANNSPPEPGKKSGFFSRLRRRSADQAEEQTPTEPAPKVSSEPAPQAPAKPTPKAPAAPKATKAPAQAVPARPPEPAASAAPETRDEAEATRASLLAAAAAEAAAAAAKPQSGMFSRLKTGLSRTRAILNADIGDLVRGRKEIDEDLLEELETLLLTADVGVPATTRIIEDLSARVQRHELARPAALVAALRDELHGILDHSAAPVRQPSAGHPQVILMVGVNGVGKTTTIGKLAKRLQAEGNSVMLAAGDTFRAAAVEQLQTWGERNQVPVISQGQGADSASVIFDALQAATARGIDVLIADTAGRLHTKSNLMEELRKIARVMQKIDPDAPHEVLLVVDATTGQNALHQAREFNRALAITGIALTKLDGTAKGGILFALADHLQIPIRFIGVGEQIDDLRYFEPDEFLDALLSP